MTIVRELLFVVYNLCWIVGRMVSSFIITSKKKLLFRLMLTYDTYTYEREKNLVFLVYVDIMSYWYFVLSVSFSFSSSFGWNFNFILQKHFVYKSKIAKKPKNKNFKYKSYFINWKLNHLVSSIILETPKRKTKSITSIYQKLLISGSFQITFSFGNWRNVFQCVNALFLVGVDVVV